MVSKHHDSLPSSFSLVFSSSLLFVLSLSLFIIFFLLLCLQILNILVSSRLQNNIVIFKNVLLTQTLNKTPKTSESRFFFYQQTVWTALKEKAQLLLITLMIASFCVQCWQSGKKKKKNTLKWKLLFPWLFTLLALSSFKIIYISKFWGKCIFGSLFKTYETKLKLSVAQLWGWQECFFSI